PSRYPPRARSARRRSGPAGGAFPTGGSRSHRRPRAGPWARDEPCWRFSLVLLELVKMTRFQVVLCLVCASACQKKDESAPTPPTHAPGTPTTPPQSAEELKAVLAKIDDVTITLGEFQERINRQSPYIRARYTSLEQKREFL